MFPLMQLVWVEHSAAAVDSSNWSADWPLLHVQETKGQAENQLIGLTNIWVQYKYRRKRTQPLFPLYRSISTAHPGARNVKQHPRDCVESVHTHTHWVFLIGSGSAGNAALLVRGLRTKKNHTVQQCSHPAQGPLKRERSQCHWGLVGEAGG